MSSIALVLFYHHLGMEDHIICAGLVLFLAESHPNIFVVVHKQDTKDFAILFQDRPVNMLVVNSYEDKHDDEILELVREMCARCSTQVLRLGPFRRRLEYHVASASQGMNSAQEYSTMFYFDASVPYSTRWSHWPLRRNNSLEQNAYAKCAGEQSFAFLMNDPMSNVHLDLLEVPDSIHVYRYKSPCTNGLHSIFDLCLLIERATLVHAVPGPLFYLADHLDLTAERKVLHLYASHASALLPHIRLSQRSTKHEWEIMEAAIGTKHLALQIESPPAHHIASLDLERTAIDVTFSILAWARLPRHCMVEVAVDREPPLMSFGSLTESGEADSPCSAALMGMHSIAEDGRCHFAVSVELERFFPRLFEAWTPHLGAHTLTLHLVGSTPASSSVASLPFVLADDLPVPPSQRTAVCVSGQLRTLAMPPDDPQFPRKWRSIEAPAWPHAPVAATMGGMTVAETIQRHLYRHIGPFDVFVFVSTRGGDREPAVGDLSRCEPLRPAAELGAHFECRVEAEEALPVFKDSPIWSKFFYSWSPALQQSLLQQLRGLHRCHAMVRRHARLSGVSYSHVMRVRPDMAFLWPFPKLSRLDFGPPWAPVVRIVDRGNCCCGNEDTFGVGQADVMQVYMDRYLALQALAHEWWNESVWTAELFVSALLLRTLNASIASHPAIAGCLVRPADREILGPGTP